MFIHGLVSVVNMGLLPGEREPPPSPSVADADKAALIALAEPRQLVGIWASRHLLMRVCERHR